MKYLGSKNRIAKEILPIMLYVCERHGLTEGVEPFVGGANMLDKVPKHFDRVGLDLNPHTIEALIFIRDHINEAPAQFSEAEYKNFHGTPAEPFSSWVRFVCAFGAKFQSGFARSTGRDHYAEGLRNAQKQSPNLQNCIFRNAPYQAAAYLTDSPKLIYCDPPYKGTEKYKNVPSFDHDKFFIWCRAMGEAGHYVFVSEYQAPPDFVCVWSKTILTNFAHKRESATHKATEKLFYYEPIAERI